jgi:PHP family Zn ribbon phosphoesterase
MANGSKKEKVKSKIPDFGLYPPAYCHRCGKKRFKQEDSKHFQKRWICENCGQGYSTNAKKVLAIREKEDEK